MIKSFLKQLIEGDGGENMAALKEFVLEKTTGQNYSHEIATLLKICKLQQTLIKEISNDWNPDVQSKLADIDKAISSLENYNASNPRT
jgi:hypothetical protein